jgi:hypothetical protein
MLQKTTLQMLTVNKPAIGSSIDLKMEILPRVSCKQQQVNISQIPVEHLQMHSFSAVSQGSGVLCNERVFHK